MNRFKVVFWINTKNPPIGRFRTAGTQRPHAAAAAAAAAVATAAAAAEAEAAAAAASPLATPAHLKPQSFYATATATTLLPLTMKFGKTLNRGFYYGNRQAQTLNLKHQSPNPKPQTPKPKP